MIVLVATAFRIIQLVVFIRLMLTWIMPGRLPKGIRPLTDPIDKVLKKFQVLIPMRGAYMDIGPLLFLLLLMAIQHFLFAFGQFGSVGI